MIVDGVPWGRGYTYFVIPTLTHVHFRTVFLYSRDVSTKNVSPTSSVSRYSTEDRRRVWRRDRYLRDQPSSHLSIGLISDVKDRLKRRRTPEHRPKPVYPKLTFTVLVEDRGREFPFPRLMGGRWGSGDREGDRLYSCYSTRESLEYLFHCVLLTVLFTETPRLSWDSKYTLSLFEQNRKPQKEYTYRIIYIPFFL